MIADRVSNEDIIGMLPKRPAESNKKTFGRVLAVCGSYGMSGAAYLCAKAAYRSGCGLVEILTAEENRVILQTSLPEATVTCYKSDSPDYDTILSAASRADAIALGCGLGRTPAAHMVTERLLSAAAVPLVIDADALNIISEEPRLWGLIHAPVVITPHPAEMSRISDSTLTQSSRTPKSRRRLCRGRGVCVLKTHSTAVTDGSRIYTTPPATAGWQPGARGCFGRDNRLSLAQQGRQPLLETAALGVYIHGLAGDGAAESLGEHSVMASDIINFLPGTIKKIAGKFFENS